MGVTVRNWVDTKVITFFSGTEKPGEVLSAHCEEAIGARTIASTWYVQSYFKHNTQTNHE